MRVVGPANFTNKSPAIPAVGGAFFLEPTLWEGYLRGLMPQAVAVLSIALVALDIYGTAFTDGEGESYSAGNQSGDNQCNPCKSEKS